MNNKNYSRVNIKLVFSHCEFVIFFFIYGIKMQ